VSKPNDERWRELCEQAAKEKDLQKLLELVHEIDRLLEAQEKKKPSRQPG
jgi:hypothetical protein